jgi:serine protease Do
MAGDVITTMDGNAVKDSRTLARKIGSMAPGTSVKLGVLHNGSEKTVTLTLGTLPDERQANAAPQGTDKGTPRLGLTLAPASAVGAGNQGVAVTAVDPNGPAAERGMQSGDVILDVAGKTVSNPSDVTKGDRGPAQGRQAHRADAGGSPATRPSTSQFRSATRNGCPKGNACRSWVCAAPPASRPWGTDFDPSPTFCLPTFCLSFGITTEQRGP